MRKYVKSAYLVKLKDPRWQKKRLEILDRDKWCCQKCFDDQSTLVVHHKIYLQDKEPWDYPNHLLITLCEDCHECETANMENTINSLVTILKSIFLSEDINNIYIGLSAIELQHQPDVVAASIGWGLSNPGIQSYLISNYFKYLEVKHHGKV